MKTLIATIYTLLLFAGTSTAYANPIDTESFYNVSVIDQFTGRYLDLESSRAEFIIEAAEPLGMYLFWDNINNQKYLMLFHARNGINYYLRQAGINNQLRVRRSNVDPLTITDINILLDDPRTFQLRKPGPSSDLALWNARTNGYITMIASPSYANPAILIDNIDLATDIRIFID